MHGLISTSLKSHSHFPPIFPLIFLVTFLQVKEEKHSDPHNSLTKEL